MLPRVALTHPDRATRSPLQGRNPKRPCWALPLSLDEPALGGPGRCGALYTACIGFRFALQTPIYTRCAPAASIQPCSKRLSKPFQRFEQTFEQTFPNVPANVLDRAGRVVGSNLHWKRQFTRPATLPQAAALPWRRLRIHPLWPPRRLVCDQDPPRGPGRQSCALRMSSASMASG